MISVEGSTGNVQLCGTRAELCAELTLLIHVLFDQGVLNEELLDRVIEMALHSDEYIEDDVKEKLMQDDSPEAKKLRELLALISLMEKNR